MKTIKVFGLLVIAAILGLSAFFSTALAFSGYGSGTSTTPDRVGTCSQLGEMANNLTGYYILVSNINCSGSTFTGLSQTFSGTLDGQDHTITNLTTPYGLFEQTNNATIENLTLTSGGTNGTEGSEVGSVVGEASNTTLNNVHSSDTVNESANTGYQEGGLVGDSVQNLNIYDSSFTGTINDANYRVGGLVGSIGDAETGSSNIDNSFFNGTLNLVSVVQTMTIVPSLDGGIVGIDYLSNIDNDYASGTMNNAASSTNLGGLIGIAYNGTIENNYSNLAIEGVGTDLGGVAGQVDNNSSTITYSNNFYDKYVTQGNNQNIPCDGFDNGTVPTCTAENATNSTPSYFFNNSQNGPFGNWDFVNTWQETSSNPILQDQSLFNGLSGVPNNGDANGDGILDSYEANVLDLESSSGNWVNITVPSSSGCTLGSGQSLSGTTKPSDPGYTRLTDFLDYDAYCPTPGMTVQVTLIYSRLIDTTGAVLLFYNPNTQSYSILKGAVFSTVTIGGNSETEVTYSITDGGAYDLSGVANGLIEDPVIIATPESSSPTSTPDTGYGRPNNSGLIVAAISTGSFLALFAGLYITYMQTRKTKGR